MRPKLGPLIVTYGMRCW